MYKLIDIYKRLNWPVILFLIFSLTYLFKIDLKISLFFYFLIALISTFINIREDTKTQVVVNFIAILLLAFLLYKVVV
jgi:hypothetical protein